jgi:hypothetical protein
MGVPFFPASPLAAAGAFFSAAAGAGETAFFFVSSEPICSFGCHFFRMLSLWYFQNCFDASLPPTLCMTVR